MNAVVSHVGSRYGLVDKNVSFIDNHFLHKLT